MEALIKTLKKAMERRISTEIKPYFLALKKIKRDIKN